METQEQQPAEERERVGTDNRGTANTTEGERPTETSSPPESSQEAQSLSSVSIPQQFAWAGLRRTANHTEESTNNAKESSSTSATLNSKEDDGDCDVFWLNDLVLWNLLGFAADLSPDYLKCQLVCKRWKSMVELVNPPVLVAMLRLMEVKRIIDLEEGASLWTTALQSLKSRDCPLYRKEDKATGAEEQKPIWPTLQPQFNVILMRFLHDLANQRDPANGSGTMYNSTCAFLTELAGETVQKFWSTLESPKSYDGSPDGHFLKQLNELVNVWRYWKGIVNTVNDLANYLDRYYVPHHSLPSIAQAAEGAFVQVLRVSLSGHDCATARALVEQFGSTAIQSKLGAHLALLSEVLDACKKLRSYNQARHLPRHEQEPLSEQCVAVYETYARVEAELESIMAAATNKSSAVTTESSSLNHQDAIEDTLERKPITIVCIGGQKFSVAAGGHFLVCSGFLSRLHLRAGDLIWLNLKPAIMEKVLEFYAMDELDPMPELPMPLQREVRELLGERYWNFVQPLPHPVLFELVSAANLLHCQRLLDLTCAMTAFMMRGRTVQEIRDIFRLPMDIEEEEAI